MTIVNDDQPNNSSNIISGRQDDWTQISKHPGKDLLIFLVLDNWNTNIQLLLTWSIIIYRHMIQDYTNEHQNLTHKRSYITVITAYKETCWRMLVRSWIALYHQSILKKYPDLVYPGRFSFSQAVYRLDLLRSYIKCFTHYIRYESIKVIKTRKVTCKTYNRYVATKITNNFHDR